MPGYKKMGLIPGLGRFHMLQEQPRPMCHAPEARHLEHMLYNRKTTISPYIVKYPPLTKIESLCSATKLAIQNKNK